MAARGSMVSAVRLARQLLLGGEQRRDQGPGQSVGHRGLTSSTLRTSRLVTGAGIP